MDRRDGPKEGAARVSFGLAAAIALHALLLGGGFILALLQREPEPQPEPISVELVEEPKAEEAQPEPPVQDKAPEPQQEAKLEEPPPEPEKAELPPTEPLDLAPAYDAPKSAQTDAALTIGDKGAGDMAVVSAPDVVQQEAPEKPPLEPPKLLPEPEPPQEPIKAEAPPAPQETAQDAPPVEPLPPTPDGVPALAQPSPETTPDTHKMDAEKPEAVDPKRFAFFAPMPKMEFESGPKESKAPAGNANDSYTSRLYGMIVPTVRLPNGLPPASRRRPLQVEFVVDGRGKLAGAVVTRSSGVPSLDIAVLYALRQAAPYPPTPNGKPLTLVLDYEPP